MFVHVPQSYRIPFLFYCTTFLDLLFPYSCKALLSFVLFSLTLLLLTLLVVPPCPKVVMMTLTFTDNRKVLIFYYLQFVFVLLSLENETDHLLIPVLFVSCDHGVQPTVLHEFHIHTILGTFNFILAVPNIESMLLLEDFSLSLEKEHGPDIGYSE